MRLFGRRKLTLGGIKAGLRRLMNDYGVAEAYLSGPVELNDDKIRPEWVRVYYFPPLVEDDFDYKAFEADIRETFRGQVVSMMIYQDYCLLDVLRRKNVTPF